MESAACIPRSNHIVSDGIQAATGLKLGILYKLARFGQGESKKA
jgi:hypothetical protein